MTITYKAMIQRETNTNRPRSIHNSNSNRHNNHFRLSSMSSLNRHSTVTSSILRRASQEVMWRPHDRHIHFSTRRDTTCVYPKGSALPLAVQKTIVFNGASKLRDLSRLAFMADHGMRRISQTYGNRHVGFGPAVEFTGRVTLQPLLEMPIGILRPIREEEEAEAGLVHPEPALGVEDMEVEPIREEDSTVVATRRPIKRRRSDEGLALEKKSSKKFCLRAEIASQVHRHGIKRKWSGSALEHNKRACIRADDSHVQSEVVEVSRFIDCSLFLISFFIPL
jgi:hypothetical protein